MLSKAILDSVLHALGRPEIPTRETYRNFYCGTPEGIKIRGIWFLSHHINDGRDPIYVVTKWGRELAAETLRIWECPRCTNVHRWRTRNPKRCRHCGATKEPIPDGSLDGREHNEMPERAG